MAQQVDHLERSLASTIDALRRVIDLMGEDGESAREKLRAADRSLMKAADQRAKERLANLF